MDEDLTKEIAEMVASGLARRAAAANLPPMARALFPTAEHEIRRVVRKFGVAGYAALVIVCAEETARHAE